MSFETELIECVNRFKSYLCESAMNPEKESCFSYVEQFYNKLIAFVETNFFEGAKHQEVSGLSSSLQSWDEDTKKQVNVEIDNLKSFIAWRFPQTLIQGRIFHQQFIAFISLLDDFSTLLMQGQQAISSVSTTCSSVATSLTGNMAVVLAKPVAISPDIVKPQLLSLTPAPPAFMSPLRAKSHLEEKVQMREGVIGQLHHVPVTTQVGDIQDGVIKSPVEISYFKPKLLYGLFFKLVPDLNRPLTLEEQEHEQKVWNNMTSNNKILLLEWQTSRGRILNGVQCFKFDGIPVAPYEGDNHFSEILLEEREAPRILQDKLPIRLMQYETHFGPTKKRLLKVAHVTLDNRRKYDFIYPTGYKLFYELWEMNGPHPIRDSHLCIFRGVCNKTTVNTVNTVNNRVRDRLVQNDISGSQPVMPISLRLSMPELDNFDLYDPTLPKPTNTKNKTALTTMTPFLAASFGLNLNIANMPAIVKIGQRTGEEKNDADFDSSDVESDTGSKYSTDSDSHSTISMGALSAGGSSVYSSNSLSSGRSRKDSTITVMEGLQKSGSFEITIPKPLSVVSVSDKDIPPQNTSALKYGHFKQSGQDTANVNLFLEEPHGSVKPNHQ